MFFQLQAISNNLEWEFAYTFLLKLSMYIKKVEVEYFNGLWKLPGNNSLPVNRYSVNRILYTLK